MKKSIASAPSSFEVRQTYLKHEAAIMMVGQLYYFIGMGLALCAVTGVFMKSVGAALPWSGILGVAAVLVVLGALYAIVGYGLRSLKVWSRYAAGFLAILCLASLRVNSQVEGYAATTLSLIGMFAMPIGIVLTGYAAYLALSPKGAVVFSRDYRRVIEATPEIQYTFAKVFMVTGVLLVAVQSFMLVPVFGVGR